MIINVDDIETGNFESLEEFVRFVESKAAIPDEDADKRNRLRFRLFKKWHDMYGFTNDDAGFVIACSFDVEMFSSNKEDDEMQEQARSDSNEYRKEREDRIRNVEEYTSQAYKKSKKQLKSKRKSIWVKKNELKEQMAEYHQKEQNIYTSLYKAKMYLERMQKRDKNLEIDAEMLAHQVIIIEGKDNLLCTQEELMQYAVDFLDSNIEDVKLSLRITSEEFVKKTDAYLEKNQKKIIAWTLLGATFINVLLLCIRFIMCIVTLDRVVVSNNEIYILLSLLISAFAWIYSTTQDYFNFYNIKWRMLIMVLVNDVVTLLQVLYTAIWSTLVVAIFKIKPNDLFTTNMVINLARIVVVMGLFIGSLAAYKLIKPFITAEEAKEKILAFKLKHIIDTRENKEFKYDFCAVKDLKTGKTITVKEHDLYTHALLLGASGTGKTSSIYIPQIVANIRKKQKNVEMQQRELLKLVRAGEVTVSKAFSHDKFGRQYFEAKNEAAKKKIEDIFERYVECGITVVAPNNSMNEDILAYASGRGIWVNNLDPVKKKATYPYERLVGMNPFYMPHKFHEIAPDDADAEEERTVFIAESANNFADALTAINELNGSADPYFTDVNTTVTSAIVTILMLYASLQDIQVTIDDVNNCIQNFGLLPAYITTIKRHFNIKYINQNIDKKKNDSPKIVNPNKPLSEEDEEKQQQQAYEQLTEEDKKNPYIQTIITCESRLQKGSKMDEHAEGLRNLIRKLLQDPRVKRVLVNNKDIIDFNEILADNAITVVNTALEFGKNTSTCFGQLFLLNFNSAVLRRPKNLRTPHYLYEDETARYLSDTIDTMVTLYRQYCVSCMFALQSLDQVEKVPHLAYLRNTFLSAGMIISFGRANYSDSETISNLGGQERYDMVQKTKSYTSMLSENASSSFSERTTPNTKNYVDPHDVRYRDFQECTILYTDEGNVLPARLGRAFFVPKEVLYKKEQRQIEQNNAWREIWRNRYPLTEDVLAVSPDSTISPKSNQDMAAVLRASSQFSATVKKTSAESLQNQTGYSNATDLKKILNTERVATSSMSDKDVIDQIRFEDFSEDDEWQFSDEIEEEVTPVVLNKTASADVHEKSSTDATPIVSPKADEVIPNASLEEAILVYDEDYDDYYEEEPEEDAEMDADTTSMQTEQTEAGALSYDNSSQSDEDELDEEQLMKKLLEQKQKRLNKMSEGMWN